MVALALNARGAVCGEREPRIPPKESRDLPAVSLLARRPPKEWSVRRCSRKIAPRRFASNEGIATAFERAQHRPNAKC